MSSEKSDNSAEVNSWSSFDPSNLNTNAPITANNVSNASSGEKKTSDDAPAPKEENKSAGGKGKAKASNTSTKKFDVPKVKTFDVPKVKTFNAPKVKQFMCLCKDSNLNELFVNQKTGLIRCQYAMSNMLTSFTDMCVKCNVVPYEHAFISINSLIAFGKLKELDCCFQKGDQIDCSNTGCDQKINRYAFCLRKDKSFFCTTCCLNALNKKGDLTVKSIAKVHTSTKIPMVNFSSEFEQFLTRFEIPSTECVTLIGAMKVLANGISSAAEKKNKKKTLKSIQHDDEKSQG